MLLWWAARQTSLYSGQFSMEKIINCYMARWHVGKGLMYGCDKRPVHGVGASGRIDAVLLAREALTCRVGEMHFRQPTDGADLTWGDLHKVTQQVGTKDGYKNQTHLLLLRTHHLHSNQTTWVKHCCLHVPHEVDLGGDCSGMKLHTDVRAAMPAGWQEKIGKKRLFS